MYFSFQKSNLLKSRRISLSIISHSSRHLKFHIGMERYVEYSQPKKPRIYWRKEIVVKTFLEACIQEITLNGREGGSLKPVSWKNVAETLKSTHNFVVEQRQMKNHYDYLKGKYGAWSKLKNKAEDVYDPLTNTFNLTEEEWQIEMKSNKYIQRLRSAPLPFPELCLQLFDGVVSTRVGTSNLSNPSPLAFKMIEDSPTNRTQESCDSTQDPLALEQECSSRLEYQIKKRKAGTICTIQIEESHRPSEEHRIQQDAHQEVMVQKLDVDAHQPSMDPDLVPSGSAESSRTGRSYARCLGSAYPDEVQRLKKQIQRMEQAHEKERLEMKVQEAVLQEREAEMEAREAKMQAREEEIEAREEEMEAREAKMQAREAKMQAQEAVDREINELKTQVQKLLNYEEIRKREDEIRKREEEIRMKEEENRMKELREMIDTVRRFTQSQQSQPNPTPEF